jgi:hypothetical protein
LADPTDYDTEAGNANRRERLPVLPIFQTSVHPYGPTGRNHGSLSEGDDYGVLCSTAPFRVAHTAESMIMWRIVRVTMACLAGTGGLFVLLVSPDLIGSIPEEIRIQWAPELAIACVLAYAIVRLVASPCSDGRKFADRARLGLNAVDRFAEWALEGGLKSVLWLLSIGLLLMWVPHYLTWPWSRDPETFAVLAQSWDHGILPYRDIRAYNFPGATYLAWVLGKVFGWGHTVPLYAFDASCVALLGFVLAAWSQRRLGDAVPGLVGYLAFLANYLSLPYDLVAQRDWHTAFLLCLGLLLLQAWPGRLSRIASALAAALALAIRPHAVLFFPALVWEAAQGGHDSATDRAAAIRAASLWCLWFSLFVALAFAPLVVAGIADDLLGGLRVAAYGGPYSKATPEDAILTFADQFRSWETTVPLVATLLLAVWPQSRLRAIAKTWSVAWLGVLFYQPIHPVHHFYLRLPIILVTSITWALPVSWLVSSRRIARPMVVLSIALLAHELMPRRPSMCNFQASVQALGPLFRGDLPNVGPVGSVRPFRRVPGAWVRWNDYREVLLYIQRETSPTTFVANVLCIYPYETINGPTGRLSPFLAESGICWMTQVNLDLDSEFADALIHCPDSVVVWSPRRFHENATIPLNQVAAAIQQYYEPAAQFGMYEVWRRKRAKSE